MLHFESQKLLHFGHELRYVTYKNTVYLIVTMDPTIDDLKKLHKDHVPKHFIYNGEIVPGPQESTSIRKI